MLFFFINDPSTTKIYTLSLHDALPIYITADKVKILQAVDNIFINGLKEHGLYDKVWQAGAMLLPVQSVGVMGDERSEEHTSELQSRLHLVCRLLLEKKKKIK